jgi:hypothetical protein
MTFEDFTVINTNEFTDWLSEFRAHVGNLPDEISKLQQRERDARRALKANGLYDAVENITDRQKRERLQGLALILGDLYFKRFYCDNDEVWQKYETFLAKYNEQVEKAKTYL